MKENYFDSANDSEGFSDYTSVDELIRIHNGKHKDELKLNINDFIAMMTIISERTIDDEPQDKKISEILSDAIMIFGHIRDEYGAKTGDEALDLIEKRKIDLETIKNWVEHNMAHGDAIITNAIKMGYPEFKNNLKEK